MTHDDMTLALQIVCPGAQWTLKGTTLIWQDTKSCPTTAQLQAALTAYTPPPTLQEQVKQLQTSLAKLISAQNK